MVPLVLLKGNNLLTIELIIKRRLWGAINFLRVHSLLSLQHQSESVGRQEH